MARHRSLQKIKKYHADLVPPANAVPWGLTPDGKQVYTEVRQRSISEPALDEHGLQRYRKNPMTGEPLVPVRKPKLQPETLMYYLESEGNGNVRRIKWRPPTPAEEAAAQRALAVDRMKDSLAETLVDAGVSPNDLADFIKNRTGTTVPATVTADTATVQETTTTPAEPEEKVDVEYPVYSSPGRWLLSNGLIFAGKKKDAIKAEEEITDEERADVAESKADSKASAEY